MDNITSQPASQRHADSITILECSENRKRAAKAFCLDDKQVEHVTPYKAGTLFAVAERSLNGIEELSKLLFELESDKRKFVIRGIKDFSIKADAVVRRKLVRDGVASMAAPFTDEAHHWLMIDIDKLSLEENINLGKEPEKAVEAAIGHLPDPFKKATVHWHLSASAHRSPASISVHLWYWLSKKRTSLELRHWAKGLEKRLGYRVADPALYNGVQPHFTSNPIFLSDHKDPLSNRSGIIHKENDVVDLEIPPAAKPSVSRDGQTFSAASNTGGSRIDYYLEHLGDHSGGEGFHEPLLKASASYVANRSPEAAERQRETFKAYLRQRIVEADQSNHVREEINRYISDFHLDQLIDSALEKKFEGQASQELPHFISQALPLQDAQEKLTAIVESFEQDIDNWLGWDITRPKTEAPRLGIKATAGLGKTEEMIQRFGIHQQFGNHIFYFVPNHELAEETATRLRKKYEADQDFETRVRVIRGRSRTDDNGDPMCQKADHAARLSARGVGVYNRLCESEMAKCEYFDDCPYIQQFKEERLYHQPYHWEQEDGKKYDSEKAAENEDVTPNILVMAHNYLFLQMEERFPYEPSLIVIDEAFWRSGIDEFTVEASELDKSGIDIVTHLSQALKGDKAILAAMREHKNHRSKLLAAAKKIRDQQTPIIAFPDSSAADLQKLADTKPASRLPDLLELLAHELDLVDREDSHALSYENGVIRCFQRKKLHLPADVPVLMIDADLNKAIVRKFFPNASFEVVESERHATVHQFVDKTFSKTSLAQGSELVNQVQEFCEAISKQDSIENKKTLIVASKKIRRLLTGENAKGLPKVGELGLAKVIHFGNLRGLDTFRDYDTVIVVGREQPNVESLQGQARALFWDDEEPIKLVEPNGSGTRNLEAEERAYRWRTIDLHGAGKKRVQVHPDDRVQSVLEQIRECESTQAIDRLRTVRGDTTKPPKTVYLLSSLVLDVTVDNGWRWNGLQNALSLWGEADGIVPLNKEDLRVVCASIGSSATAARRIREIQEYMPLVESILGRHEIGSAKYRKAGQKSASKLIFGHTAPAFSSPSSLEKNLTRKIGHEVGIFELERSDKSKS